MVLFAFSQSLDLNPVKNLRNYLNRLPSTFNTWFGSKNESKCAKLKKTNLRRLESNWCSFSVFQITVAIKHLIFIFFIGILAILKSPIQQKNSMSCLSDYIRINSREIMSISVIYTAYLKKSTQHIS